MIKCLITGLALVQNFTQVIPRRCEQLVPLGNTISMSNCSEIDCLNSCLFDSYCQFALYSENECIKSIGLIRLDNENAPNNYKVFKKDPKKYVPFYDIRCDALYTKKKCISIPGCAWDNVCYRDCSN